MLMLKFILKKCDTKMTYVARNMDSLRAVLNTTVDIRFLQIAVDFLTSLATVSFSKQTLLRRISSL
jgi:two-component SAPR family response regulator